MRRDFATDSSVSTTGLRAVLVAGELGSGAGLLADIIADVVRLSLGRVQRRRKAIGVDRRPLTVERLDIDATSAGRHDDFVGLAILCDHQAEAALPDAVLTADERIILDDGVPAWRQNLLPPERDPEPARIRSIEVAARGAAAVGRRFPYAEELWRRSLARHVPKRYREAALAKFDAEVCK
jgi:hypothetical protein